MSALAPAAVDLDEDIRARTPSGWPMQASPPPLAVQMNGRVYRIAQGKTHEGLHALLWPVSRLLVRYIERHVSRFVGKRVLELGAGVGLTGIGAAAYGAHVLLTDKETSLTVANVEAARCVGVEGSVSAEALDWADSAAFLQNSAAGPPWAWVLCSDCVYHQQLDFRPVQALARLLAALTEPRADGSPPPVCLFGYQERDSAARYAFWDALSANGLQVRERSLEECAAEGVDVSGLSGPMVLWFISRRAEETPQLAPAEC